MLKTKTLAGFVLLSFYCSPVQLIWSLHLSLQCRAATSPRAAQAVLGREDTGCLVVLEASNGHRVLGLHLVEPISIIQEVVQSFLGWQMCRRTCSGWFRGVWRASQTSHARLLTASVMTHLAGKASKCQLHAAGGKVNHVLLSKQGTAMSNCRTPIRAASAHVCNNSHKNGGTLSKAQS